MTREDFKYTTKMDRLFPVHTSYATEHGKYISEASLKELTALGGSAADIKSNYDLLYNVFNAAVINRINKNDDGIDSSTAVSIYKQFIHKPANLEHKRDLIVGHIVNAGFAEYKTNRIMSEEEASQSKDPYYLSLSAVVYKLVDAEFCDLLIGASDETSASYNSISTSWEIGFNSYHIVVGHRDVAQGQLITDPETVEAYSQYLRVYGGEGKLPNGSPVYRLITGEVLPLGIGYTSSPAADVLGVLVSENVAININDAPASEEDKIKKNAEILAKLAEIDVEEAVENLTAAINTFNSEKLETSEVVKKLTNLTTESVENQENNKNISSQTNSHTVKTDSIMKINSINDITDEVLKEVSAANCREFLADQIDKVSTEYAEKLEVAKQEAELKKSEAAQTQASLDQVSQELTALKEQLEAEKQARASEKAQADFNDRMSDLEAQFNLTPELKSVVAKAIRGQDEATFAAWKKDFEILAAEKNKSFKPAVASVTEAVASAEDVLDNAGVVTNPSIVNIITDRASAKAKWAEAFRVEDIVIAN